MGNSERWFWRSTPQALCSALAAAFGHFMDTISIDAHVQVSEHFQDTSSAMHVQEYGTEIGPDFAGYVPQWPRIQCCGRGVSLYVPEAKLVECNVMWCNVFFCYVMLCYVMLCIYVMLGCVMYVLVNIIPQPMARFAFGIHLWISTRQRLGADTHPGDFTEHHFPIPIYSFASTMNFFYSNLLSYVYFHIPSGNQT